jgi:hypothetical protein
VVAVVVAAKKKKQKFHPLLVDVQLQKQVKQFGRTILHLFQKAKLADGGGLLAVVKILLRICCWVATRRDRRTDVDLDLT